MTTVAIVEGNTMMRAGIEQVIQRSERLRIVASVGTVEELELLTARPDVIVLDLAACRAQDPVRVVSALAEHAVVLAMPASDGGHELLSLLQAGACGLVTHDTGADEFLAAVEAVALGSVYLAGGVARIVGAELRHRPISEPRGLTRREIETLRLLAYGHTHRQIARRLGLTETTVNTYVKRIRAKLNAGNKAELTRMAIDLGYATTGEASRRLRPALVPQAAIAPGAQVRAGTSDRTGATGAAAGVAVVARISPRVGVPPVHGVAHGGAVAMRAVVR